MTYAPNANWTAAIDDQDQAPVYFLRISGLSSKDYSTAPVKSAAVTKTVLMNTPSGGELSLDLIAGTQTVGDVDVELVDVGDEITDLIATEAIAAPLSTLVNRTATVYGGYRDLAESDYAAVFTGRIRRVQANRDLTGYILTLSNLLTLLDGEICSDATEGTPAVIEGNVVNVYWALLTGTFSTVHADFPLTYVGTGAISPTGSSTPSGGWAAFTSPANGYDGSTGTFAEGVSGAATKCAVDYTFAAGTGTGRIRVVASVDPDDPGGMFLAYSLDGGATFTGFSEVRETSAFGTEYLGPVLFGQDMSVLVVRAAVGTASGTGRVHEVSLSSATPTGLGLTSSQVNETQLEDQRDTWHPADSVRVVLTEPESARRYLEAELFRPFQAFPAIAGDGKVGLRFHVPALPASTAQAVTTTDHIVAVADYERMYEYHLNRFTIRGDYDWVEGEYSDLYATETSEDTADQSATGETIEYLVESKWLHTDLDGPEIAEELASRMRIRFLRCPARVKILVNFRRRNIEHGDVIKITDPRLPNLFTGTRGLTDWHMTVLAINPRFEEGLLELVCLDTGFKRYGVIAPDAAVAYASATDEEQNTYFYICSDAGVMSDGTDGYRFI